MNRSTFYLLLGMNAFVTLAMPAYAQTPSEVGEILIPSIKKRIVELYDCFVSKSVMEVELLDKDGNPIKDETGNTLKKRYVTVREGTLRIRRTSPSALIVDRDYAEMERDALQAAFVQRLLNRVGVYSELAHTDEEFASAYMRQRLHLREINHVPIDEKLLVQLANAIASLRCEGDDSPDPDDGLSQK